MTLALGRAFSAVVFVLCWTLTVIAQGPIILKFTASWCQPCQSMKPIDEQLRKEGLVIREVDCSSKVPPTFAPWVQSLPTYLAYDSKENYLGRQVGSCSKETLVRLVSLQKKESNAQQENQQAKIATTKTPSDVLVEQAYRWKVGSVLSGKQHPALQAAAQQHANYQASIGQQGHQNWDQRKNQVQSQLPGYNVEECAAESWPWTARDIPASASEMFNSWRQSPGHWAAVNGSCAYWGYAMAYCQRNQTWYAAALFANGRQQRFKANYQAPEQTEKPKKTNFIVYAQGVSKQASQQIADTAERLRRDLAIEWLGKEFPAWQNPCPIYVRVHNSLGGGGTTCFTFGDGEVYDWRMSIQGSDVSTILGSVLPHEVTHTIFATHFRQSLPRWADEGASTTMEMVSERNKHARGLAEYLQTGRGIPFEIMLTLTEYPQDILPLYAQGYSASSYLIEAGGRRQFISFLEDSLAQSSYDKPLKTHYNLSSPRAFQKSWLSWVQAGSPPAPNTQQVNYRPGCPSCNQWQGNQWQQQQQPYYQQQSQPQARPPQTYTQPPPVVQTPPKPSTLPPATSQPPLVQVPPKPQQTPKEIVDLTKQLEDLKKQIENIKVIQGPPGQNGKDGTDGKDGINKEQSPAQATPTAEQLEKIKEAITKEVQDNLRQTLKGSLRLHVEAIPSFSQQ